MAIVQVYRTLLGLSGSDAIAERFLATLLRTNKTHEFFVDWNKVRRNVEAHRFEISVLNAVCGSVQVKADLKEAIARHPEVVGIFPLIIAVRHARLEVLNEDSTGMLAPLDYDFSGSKVLSSEEADKMVYFCCKTGIVDLFESLRLTSLRDYLLGVEVGTDTNARKNRSGTWMERQIDRHLSEAARAMPGSEIITQKTFAHVQEMGHAVPASLLNRRFDIFYNWHKANINIETNYFGGGGSKPQEIVDSYIDRQRQLAASGWRFILITDGMGWDAGANQLRRGILELDFMMNLTFVSSGLLKAAIQECAK